MDKIKYIRVQNANGTYSDNIPITAAAEDIILSDGTDAETAFATLKAGMSGPASVDLVQEMVDSNKIYIYTGSETGYTFGHWYYYNGTNWTDGGAYGGSGNGGGGVSDVQVNGTSIVSSGVANVPVATVNGTLGLVKLGANTNGLDIANSGNLVLKVANSSAIKTGTADYYPIAPSKQHESAFYGLAKAAGDSTQSASSNAVGTYTDDAKVKIQKMLGIYEAPWELLNEITLTEESGIDVSADSNGTPYDLKEVLIQVFYPANTATASTGYARFYFSDGTHSLYSESGKYQTQTNPSYKLIHAISEHQLGLVEYQTRSATDGQGTWSTKPSTSNGFYLNFGNIQRIYMSTDVEPAGTQITIYGRRAY